MKRTTLLILFLLISAGSGLAAQTFSLITGREPVTSLDGLWRFHTGDNPVWASPNFDDSQWPLLRSDEPWASQGYKGYSGFAWYRFRIFIPAGLDHVSLLLPPLLTSYQVFVDGKQIGAFSRMPPHELVGFPLHAKYQFDVGKTAEPRVSTVALRVWHWSGWARYRGGGPLSGGALVGQSSQIDARFQHQRDSRLLSFGGSYSLALLTATSGTFGLLLFLVRRKETEYLWFALNELSDAILYGFGVYESVHAVPLFGRDTANELLQIIARLSFIFFLQKLLHGRRSILFYMAIAAVAIDPILYFMLMLGLWPGVGSMNLTQAALSLVILAWSCDLLVRRAKEGMPDARLLLAPVLIALGLDSATQILMGAFQLGWLKTYFQPFTLFQYPFSFDANDLMEVLFLIAMLAILANRFMRTRREEQRMITELEAARSVQSLLVPASAQSTPGFTVDSVYLPASEVGGDFFHMQPASDGSLLIVVGDVSGKGLKAAMTVSAIIGALRGNTITRPSEVIAYLNRVLDGQIAGFVTCCVTRISQGGEIVIANAGHLSPYCNATELTITNGLPLGIATGSSYQESHFTLAPGDRLTFISDGVVEAANTRRELFGFDRAAQIINQSAAAIAEAAQQWGQDDDITVLTVARVIPVAV